MGTQTPATLGESHSLKLLSEWATPGLWKTGFAHWGRIQICGTDRTIGELNAYAGLGGREKELNAEQEANGKFICALVNAFRAGELCAVSETRMTTVEFCGKPTAAPCAIAEQCMYGSAPSATRLSDLPEANELASALKDAARYRWWRSKWVGADGEFDVLNDYLAACDTPGACDAAIDAGIKEKP